VAPVPTVHAAAPPPPPPSAAQLSAFQALKAETDAFESGAKEYRDTVTTIIRLHYEAKKKEILSGLDDEIAIEKGEAKKARDTAIKRLEEFIATYTGPRAIEPESPDAMYRLAALYEDRARAEDATDDISVGLKPAIALYKRIINEFPSYERRAAIFYFLAHAYDDAGRTPESQQVFRALVCSNHFKYPTPPDPKSPDHDTILPMPQDHDEEYWSTWRNLHPDANSLKKGGADTVFVDPYPADCTAMPRPDLLPGEPNKYAGDGWWNIGNWEFDQFDVGGGVVKDQGVAVYDLDRAASAYQHAMQYNYYPIFGVALYKYAWTLFKQQRYQDSTKQFVQLLLYTDKLLKERGDPGVDFQTEAFQWIAGSLANLDFVGPGPNEPFMQRPDITDTDPDPVKAEPKLHVAIDRLHDPSLIPQDRTWTIEIYRALADEFRSLNEFNNAIEVYNDILKKWPMHPTAPVTQNAVAETYDQMNITKRVNTPEHDAIAAKALEARTALANYIGNTPWVDANKDNPEAIERAETLVRGGLKSAAAQHTNNANAAVADAQQSGDPGHISEQLTRAQSEYKLAALGWAGYLHQDENAPDAYESRYWLAQARHEQVKIEVILAKLKKGAPPSSQEIAEARQAAIDVRDSNEDDKYLMNAAIFVVDLSDVDRDIAFQQFADSNGAAGFEDRQTPRYQGDNGTGKPFIDPIPTQIQTSMQSRDDYITRVPAALDVTHNAIEYKTYDAGQYYLYGHFDEARARYEPIYAERCGKDKYGYEAWEKLIVMSNHLGDAERSRELAQHEKDHPCAISEDQKAKASLIVDPTLQEAAYAKAAAKLKQAQDAPPGPDKDRLWRETAGLYEAALAAAPSRAEAPEGAMNAAYAYKQVGEFNKAIDMYNMFIGSYGSEETLNALQKGDPKKKTAPDQKQYEARVTALGNAYDALSTTYYSFFNYQRAAETKEKISSNARFDEKRRKDAAGDAMELYNALGQRDKMLAQYKLLTSLHPAADEQAKADYTVADYDYHQWSPQAGDSGSNRNARVAAEGTLTAFYARQHNRPAAAKYALESAYQIAKMAKSVGDPTYHQWLKTTMNEWEFLDRNVPAGKDGKKDSQNPPYADYVAEAEYTLLDEEIHEKYDYDTGHHHFAGSVEEIIGKVDPKTGRQLNKGKYQTDAELADKYDKALDHIAKTYPSVEWVPAAIARKGTLYDSLRTGLYNTVPPALKYFTPQQERLLKTLENSGRDDLAAQADDLRSTVKEAWRTNKEKQLGDMDTIMVRDYAGAVALARKYNVRNKEITLAINRLAYFTDIIGDAKMKDYVTATVDPTDPAKQAHLNYSDGMFVQQRPGLSATPPPDANSQPLPVAP
jgi:tetratricopeptide (TPR) repeat protein